MEQPTYEDGDAPPPPSAAVVRAALVPRATACCATAAASTVAGGSYREEAQAMRSHRSKCCRHRRRRLYRQLPRLPPPRRAPLVAPCFSTAVLEARKQSVVASLTLATTMYYFGTSMLRSIHDDVQRLLLLFFLKS